MACSVASIRDGNPSWMVGVAPVGDRQDGDDARVVIDGVQAR
jgi:hypothetical protein